MNATHTSVQATAPIRRLVADACAAAAACVMTLLVVGANWMIYLALDDNTPSMETVLRRMPRLICGLSRVCSA